MKLLEKTIIAFFLVVSWSCTGELVFSDLANPRARLILKGTYETHDPYDWFPFFNDDAYDTLTGLGGELQGTEFATITQSHTPAQLEWYIDLAEVRIAQGQGAGGQEASKYWGFLTRNRLLLCSRYDALQGRELKNCKEQGGKELLKNFFTQGIELVANDVEPKLYNHVGLYYRKIITNPALLFTENGNFQSQITAVFENRGVNGMDIEERYQFSLQGNTTLLFPLERKDFHLVIPDEERPYVLEIRTFLKNNLNRHVIRVPGNGSTIYFLGPADFMINHRYNAVLQSGRLGGNILFEARVYQIGKTGTLDVSSITIANGGGINYKAAIPSGKVFDPYREMAYAATRGNGSEIANLPEGVYEIVALCDKKRRVTDDAEQAGFDGFPETVSPPCAQATVTTGVVTVVPPATCTCP